MKGKLEGSVVYAAKGVLGIMPEHARKETGRHLEALAMMLKIYLSTDVSISNSCNFRIRKIGVKAIC